MPVKRHVILYLMSGLAVVAARHRAQTVATSAQSKSSIAISVGVLTTNSGKTARHIRGIKPPLAATLCGAYRWAAELIVIRAMKLAFAVHGAWALSSIVAGVKRAFEKLAA